MNIADAITFQSRHQPEALAICAPGVDLVTYARLEATVNNIIRRAIVEGLKSGHLVAILVSQPVFHAALILAFARLGVVTASLSSAKIPVGMRFDAIVSDRGQRFPNCKTLLADSGWTMGDGRPLNVNYVAGSSDLCRIMFTSGTTGEAKGVAVTHDMLRGRLLRYNTVYGPRVPHCSRVFCDLGWSTALGYQFLLYTLSRGGAFFVRGDTPQNTLRAFDFYRVDHLVASPAGLAELVVEYDKGQCAHAVDIVHAAGSTLTEELSVRVRSRLGSNLICDYGSAETSCVASAPASQIKGASGAVGFVAPGMVVEILDDTGRPVPAGQEGVVRIRGDYVATQYFNDAATSQDFFRDGWFYPGDLGSLTTDGMLIISGRHSTVLNLGGEKIKPEIIESVLASFGDGLESVACAVINQLGVEEVWAVVAAQQAIDETRLRQHCRERLANIFVPKRFIVVDQLPRNDMGKIDRTRIAQVARAN